MRNKIGFILILILIILIANAVASGEPVREITNCVHGDSMTPEVCEKFDEVQQAPSPPERTAVEPVIVEQPIIDYGGK